MKLTLFFKTDTITVTEAESARSIDVTEWKPSGSILATIEQICKSDSVLHDKGQSKPIELVEGDFVALSADRTSITAVKAGYPRILINEQEKGKRVTVSIEPMISISQDGWKVALKLYPSFEGGQVPRLSDILAILEEEGIVWGIREKKIEEALAMAEKADKPAVDEIIVRGRLPVNGEDAKLRLNFLSGHRAGKEDSSGTIDFKERNLFIAVEEGQLLATRVAATEGIPGVNIFGHEVPQLRGRELNFNPGPDVVFNEVTGEITSAISGVVSAVNDTSVKISDKLSLSGDIDYSTGNVDCRGAVEISGSIKPDFRVTAGGDMLIGGNIESAHVKGAANVVVRGGMIGKKSELDADGSVDMVFVESGRISCGGIARITKQAYFCRIYSAKNIEFEDGTTILGSKIIAGAGIKVAHVDTETSPLSFLAAAVDYRRYQRFLELKQERAELEAKLRRLEHRLGPGVTNDDLEDLEEDLEDVVETLEEFNLVPCSPSDDAAGGIRYACKQKIIITGGIQPGVVVRIGNFETMTERKMAHGFFRLISETGEIVFVDDTTAG